MSLKTRLRHCLKGCYVCILDAIEQFCRIRCVHKAAKETLQKQGRVRAWWRQLGSFLEMEGPVREMMVEKWGVSGLHQPPSIWREIYICVCVYIYVCISPGIGVPSVLVAPVYSASVWLWGMRFTLKMVHTMKEDLSVLSWARAVLAPLDAVGIHYCILARCGLHGASRDHLLPLT